MAKSKLSPVPAVTATPTPDTNITDFPEYPRILNSHHQTDLGNAMRLAEKFEPTLRYEKARDKFYIFNGQFWEQTDAVDVVTLAAKVIQDLYLVAATVDDRESRQKFIDYALKCESLSKLNAMVQLSKSLPEIRTPSGKFDSDPWLLNFTNGTYDLRTGALRPHRKEDYLTVSTKIKLDSKAAIPRLFSNFLDRIFAGHIETIEFVQRAIGYCLTGSTREQCLFILHGGGKNGKSTLINVVQALMGGYAQTASPDMLMARRPGSATNDIAKLCDARTVTATESSEGNRLQENLIKQLTGGDKMAARFLFGEWFEFTPQFKILLACNHKPIIRGTDEGIWRRIKLIPFLETITNDECDLNLIDKLKLELPGIMNWALEGAAKWHKEGLGYARDVMEASASYRSEMDSVGQFLDQMCHKNAESEVGAKDLYSAYLMWCDELGEKPKGPQKFKSQIEEKGFSQHRNNSGIHWKGMGL